MAIDSNDKLTSFYDSGRVIVTSEFANSLFGGLHSTIAGDLLEPDDPQVSGHIHDGQHMDGHAQKINLESHVTSQLKNINLGDGAVHARNIQCYPESEIDKAIPIYEIVEGERCYYLDLSGFEASAAGEDTQVQFNEMGSFGANSGFVYRYSAKSVGIRVQNMDQNDDYALSVRGDIQAYSDSLSGSSIVSDGDFAGGAPDWLGTNGFMVDVGSEYAIYSHDAAGGELSQDISSSVTPNRWYILNYSVSNFVNYGTISAELTNDIASDNITLSLENGSHSVEFKSNEIPSIFKIRVSSGDLSEGFVLDDITLTEMLGGNIDVHGTITGGGQSGIKINSEGLVGIGTSSPNRRLHIVGDGIDSPVKIENIQLGAGAAIVVDGSGNIYTDPTLGVQNLFSNINIVDDSFGVASGGPIIADASSDTLTLDAGTGIEIAGNAATDTVSILLNADLDDLNNVNDPPGLAGSGDVLIWDGYVWGPGDAAGGGESEVKFFSQWTSTADWVQKFGDPDFKDAQDWDPADVATYDQMAYRHRFAPYVFYVPDFANNNNPGLVGNTIRILRDSSQVSFGMGGVWPIPMFNLTTAIPLNGDLSAGVGASIVGSHQASLPGYLDAVSGFPDDPPSSCRVTLYFLLAEGVQGTSANFNVDLLCMRPVGPLNAPMLEYQDGELIWSGLNSGQHSSTTIMRNIHSYPGVVNGTLVVSDFSPLKIDLSKINGGLCTFTTVVTGAAAGGYFGTAQGVDENPVADAIALIGARLLWIWDTPAEEGQQNQQQENSPPSSKLHMTHEGEQTQLDSGGVVNDDTNVSINGSGSSDPDGDDITYIWTLSIDGVAQPDPGNVSSFVVNTAAIGGSNVEVGLTVSDGTLNSLESIATFGVIALNQAPTVTVDAVSGVLETGPGQNIDIAATAADVDGVIAVYAWTIDSEPQGATASFTSPNTEDTSFITDTIGTYTVRLTVTDDDGATAFDVRTFVVASPNQAPTADITGPSIGQTGALVYFLGSNSFDPDGSLAAYDWSITQQPPGSSPVFSSINGGVDRKFIADIPGVYRITLRVMDNDGEWSPIVFLDFTAT